MKAKSFSLSTVIAVGISLSAATGAFAEVSFRGTIIEDSLDPYQDIMFSDVLAGRSLLGKYENVYFINSEIDRILQHRYHQDVMSLQATMEQSFLSLDNNADGIVELDELPPTLRFVIGWRYLHVSADGLDLDGDKHVDAYEKTIAIQDAASQILFADQDYARLSQLDMNADGVMTGDDIAAFETLYETGNYDVFQDEDQRGELATCGLPMPNAQDELIVLTASSSNMSVNVGFGDHSPASTMVVNIEDGTTPLFIVVGARSDMIVLFEGDVSRVRQMIGYGKGIGVSGLPTDAVTVQNEPLCLAFLNSYPISFMSPLDEERRADFYAYQRARASVLFRTQVEQIVRLENVAHVGVPSYSESDYLEPLDITDKNFNRTMLSYDWSGSELVPRPPRVFDHEKSHHFGRLLARNSAGMVYVDPAQILTNPRLVEANPLSATMRLLELVDLGVLSVENENTYRILKPIADLPALRNRNFIVDAGIEMPTSGIADACVLDDTTGIWHGQDDCPIRAAFTF